MSNPFRKSVIDKLSSPEKLDQSIIIIAPSFWVAALGGLLVIAVALVWSIIGRLPVNVSAGGMYMGAGGLQSVVAEADGVVDTVYVNEGDEVNKGQKIAQLDSAVFDEQISALQTRKTDVESVTFWSSDDPETADTKSLLEIKAQAGLADTNLTADQIALRERSCFDK
jgi:multidrug efflux pump subunit AcrA (membrane-fusion protein)